MPVVSLVKEHPICVTHIRNLCDEGGGKAVARWAVVKGSSMTAEPGLSKKNIARLVSMKTWRSSYIDTRLLRFLFAKSARIDRSRHFLQDAVSAGGVYKTSAAIGTNRTQ